MLVTLLVFVQGAVWGAAAMNFGQGSPVEYGWRGGMHNVCSAGLLLFLFGIVYWYYVAAVGAGLAIAVWYVRRVRRRAASETLPRGLGCPEVREPGRPTRPDASPGGGADAEPLSGPADLNKNEDSGAG